MWRAFKANSDGGAVGMVLNGLLALVVIVGLGLGLSLAVNSGSANAETTQAGPVVPDGSQRSAVHQFYLDSKAESEAQPTHTIFCGPTR